LLSKNLNIKVYRTIIFPVVLVGYETRSLTLREKRMLRLFGKRVLWRIFGPKRDEVLGERRKLLNNELNDLYTLPNIVRVIKSRIMRLAGHAARLGEEGGTYRVLAGKPEVKRHWGDPCVDKRIILEWIFRKWVMGVWTGLGWLRIDTSGGHM
jgi:hypothetical protein